MRSFELAIYIPFVARFKFERALFQTNTTTVAGVDEAGRGPLAGPVVAAAVILPGKWIECGLPRRLQGLNDSKQLTALEREGYFGFLTSHPEVSYSIACVEVETIDGINIFQASHQAMREALGKLQPSPQHVLVDGPFIRSLPFPQTPVIDGDARCFSIAAASVLAKVTRDRLMNDYDWLYPDYGFASHKGYATAKHFAALELYGPCPIHRRSFSPVRVCFAQTLTPETMHLL